MLAIQGAEGTCRLLGKFDLHGYVESENRTLIIGGMFPIHFRSIPEKEPTSSEPVSPKLLCLCRFNFRGFRWAKAMIHAIHEVNNRLDILPNITLGYHIYDTCFTTSRTVEATLAYLTGQNETMPNIRCSAGAPLIAVIGAGGSTLTIASSRILGLYYFPEVGYASSCSVLSDKYQFPSFLRTIPNDDHQSLAMAELVRHFGWVWIGTIAADDDYGKYGIKYFKQNVEKYGICIAFSETIPKIYSREKILAIVDAIKESTANIIVVYSSDIDLSPLMEEIAHSNITGKTWIASEAWVTSALIAKPEYFPFLRGTIGFGIRRGDIPGLKDFLLDVHPDNDASDDLTIEFWQTAFNCTWPNSSVPYNTDFRTNVSGQERGVNPVFHQLCTGKEKLEDIKNTYLDVSELRITYNIYKAVFTVAHALNNLDTCVEGNGPFPKKSCAIIDDFEPWQLMYYLKNVKFTTFDNELIKIDDNGDVYASYDIINWQLKETGEISFVKIGIYNDTKDGHEMKIYNNDSIFWNTPTLKPPRSVCTESCQSGTRKGIQHGVPVCCFVCIPCADGEISNETEARECFQCPDDYWPNTPKNECVLKEVEFLAYTDALGTTLVVLSLFGACIVLSVTFVFRMHRNTALMKANDRELSFLIQLSLVITLLSSFFFVGKPEEWSCQIRQVILALGFSLCLSCILGKTIVLLLKYRHTKFKPTEKHAHIVMQPLHQKLLVLISVIIEVCICTAYLACIPPYVYKNMEFQNVKIILECNEGSIEFLCIMFGFDVFLAVLCFITAFIARKLPNNFNEAKFITFGMLVFFIVWISFVPAYLSTRGKFKVAVEIFAILASSFGLLGCIFVPKCYIILLKPERNTEEIISGKATTNDKSAPPSSASCTTEISNSTLSTLALDE
ncbi:vomeronasal type-2 receptor 1-like [Pelodiscus sinensis]|uniref:vomeronasal type-2 receptor 1-like n=1 Tax=Pelodiscus sinensis TaxID=13735 RepID=UPI003F6D9A8B